MVDSLVGIICHMPEALSGGFFRSHLAIYVEHQFQLQHYMFDIKYASHPELTKHPQNSPTQFDPWKRSELYPKYAEMAWRQSTFKQMREFTRGRSWKAPAWFSFTAKY